jgi:hypothetical protein
MYILVSSVTFFPCLSPFLFCCNKIIDHNRWLSLYRLLINKNTGCKKGGQDGGDIAGYLQNTVGTVPLVLDLHITNECWGSNTDPTLNGHLHYPNDLDKPLNEVTPDKIRKYRTDYNQNPPNTISFMPTIVITSGRLHSEFVRILFLQDHWETDVFFAVQESNLHKTIVEVSTTTVRHSPVWLRQKRTVFRQIFRSTFHFKYWWFTHHI